MCARWKAGLRHGLTRACLSIPCILLSIAPAQAAAGPAIVEPAPGGSPYRQPQMASDGGTVALTFGEDHAVLFAKSTDGGRTFSAPVTVARPGVLSLGAHRGPRVALASKAIVISAIFGEKGRGADGDLVAWRSTDGGLTWSKGARINDKPGAAREGLHSMAADGDFLYAVWLDDRDGGKTLYGASSRDAGSTWSANRKIYASPDGHICECCHPSVATRSGGKEIFAMFRNWLGGSRDMYLAKSTDGGVTFSTARLGEGTWPLNACPMDGGSLVLDRKGPVTVWRRNAALFMARPGEKEVELGAGKNVTMAGGTVAWTSAGGLWMKRGSQAPAMIDHSGAFPAAAPGVLAWESGRVIKVLATPPSE